MTKKSGQNASHPSSTKCQQRACRITPKVRRSRDYRSRRSPGATSAAVQIDGSKLAKYRSRAWAIASVALTAATDVVISLLTIARLLPYRRHTNKCCRRSIDAPAAAGVPNPPRRRGSAWERSAPADVAGDVALQTANWSALLAAALTTSSMTAGEAIASVQLPFESTCSKCSNAAATAKAGRVAPTFLRHTT